MNPDSIDAYDNALAPADVAICARLRAEIERGLPGADSKVWHGHPVWFIKGNPIVGYDKLKDCVRLLFWSQSFDSPGLTAGGKFKAAEKRYVSVDEVDGDALEAWLDDARRIQWDYKNIVKRKGRLERLGDP
jgi:hypothetical protein